MNSFRLAHVSDLHLPLAERPPRLRELLSKRFFSWLSWRSSRRFIHRPEILAALMADVGAERADHLAVTGDLVNLALPDEFVRARRWLEARGGPEAVTIALGNHDALVPVPWADGPGQWEAWMGDAASEEDFPFVKRAGSVAFVGLSSAIPTAPFLATGRIGEAQLARLEAQLRTLEKEGLFRIVLIHHPITEGAISSRKALIDRAAVREVLARAGAELVLHGHAHHASREAVAGPHGPIAVIGAPSASSAPGAKGEPAGWRLVEVTPSNHAWRLSVVTRTMGPDGETFSTTDHFTTDIPRTQSGPSDSAGSGEAM